MKIVTLFEHKGSFLTFITTDEGESAPEPSTIYLGMRPGERPAMQKQADTLARTIGATLYLGPPEDHSLDFEPTVELEDEAPAGVDVWMTLARGLGSAGPL